MTAIITRPLRDNRTPPLRDNGAPVRRTDTLLRFAMRFDATLCAAAGLLIAMAADPLSRLSGLTPTSEWIAGAALVVYGVALYALAGVPAVRRIGVAIVIANVVFAVAVLAVLIAGVLPLTDAGVVMMLATAIGTLGFAHLQYLGVRRLA
jgi:hypothetical protein